MGNTKFMYEHEEDEPPKTPISQIFLRLLEPTSEVIIHCAMGFQDPINLEELKKAISNSNLIKHPRFSSIMVRDHNGNRNHWKRTRVNIDDHFIVHHTTGLVEAEEEEGDKEAAVNAFLAEIAVSTPLSENKPLWEVHVLVALKCVVLRVHHAIGDGASLMSMLSACFGKKKSSDIVVNGEKSMKDDTTCNNNAIAIKRDQWKVMIKGIWELMKSIWFTNVFVLRALGRLLWVKDKVTMLSGGDGVELWPRKIATAKFLLEDFKSIKMAIPGATINDVLLGVISSGFSKYLKEKSPEALQQALQLTTIVPVNLREYPYIEEMSELMNVTSNRLAGWGNKTGIIFLPIFCCDGLHPLDHVRAAKATMEKKKHSYEAYFLYKVMTFLVSVLGLTELCSCCFHKALRSATMVISNIQGPSEEMVIANNLVTYTRVNVSSLPHAITIYMVSYAKTTCLQVMVAKDIVPDPEILVSCFHNSFLEMKNSIKLK